MAETMTEAVLGDRAAIGTVLIDRGFLDGPDLWALNEAGIRFVIPARHDLRVYAEARRAAANEVPTHRLHTQSRTRTVRHRPEGGRGKLIAEERTTEAIGVEGCTTFTTYAPAADVERSEHKRLHRRDFVVLAYALTQGYRAWLDAQVRQEDAGKPQTLGGYVRRIEAENRDKLLVFVGDTYGIFYSCEFSMLLGRRVRQPNPKAAPNVDALMARLRAPPPSA